MLVRQQRRVDPCWEPVDWQHQCACMPGLQHSIYQHLGHVVPHRRPHALASFVTNDSSCWLPDGGVERERGGPLALPVESDGTLSQRLHLCLPDRISRNFRHRRHAPDDIRAARAVGLYALVQALLPLSSGAIGQWACAYSGFGVASRTFACRRRAPRGTRHVARAPAVPTCNLNPETHTLNSELQQRMLLRMRRATLLGCATPVGREYRWSTRP